VGNSLEAHWIYFDAVVFCVGWHEVAKEGENSKGSLILAVILSATPRTWLFAFWVCKRIVNFAVILSATKDLRYPPDDTKKMIKERT